jgi:subfamily B ATP-binding cassette protein MsbA
VVLLGFLESLSEGVGVSLFIPLLRRLISPATPATGGWLIERLDGLFRDVPADRRLAIAALSLFAVILTTAALAYAHGVLFAWVDGRIAHHLRRTIFDRLLAMPFGTIERDRSGRLLNVLASDTWRTSEALRVVVHLLVTASTVIVYVVLLLLMSWRLTVVVTVGILLVSVLIQRLSRGVRQLGEAMARSNSELAHRMIESLDGMRVIRAFGREAYEQERFDAVSSRLRSAILRTGFVEGAVHPVHVVLVSGLLLAIVLATAGMTPDVSVLLVFVLVLYRLQPRVKDLEAARVRLASLSSSVDEVRRVLSVPAAPPARSEAAPLPALRDGIVFDHVSYAYEETVESALKDVSFSIPAGRTTALVGPSGGGKSTIIKLLLRFHEPTTGQITVDGRVLSEIDVASWRMNIGLVGQDGFLFNATVRENIAYGKVDATDAEIVEAARQANAHEFIERLPDKYATIVGPRGVRLSGGQQQRLALARAIVRDARILILDEATNALDSLSEDWIQQALERLGAGRTVIMIAHRFATIERADQILVLDDGHIQERGTLADLVAAGGLFARMHRLQHRTLAVAGDP